MKIEMQKIVLPAGTFILTARGFKDGPRSRVTPFQDVRNLPAGVRRAVRKALNRCGRRAEVILTLPKT